MGLGRLHFLYFVFYRDNWDVEIRGFLCCLCFYYYHEYSLDDCSWVQYQSKPEWQIS